jgi:tetratricopeptide (TPR) repeat protein
MQAVLPIHCKVKGRARYRISGLKQSQSIGRGHVRHEAELGEIFIRFARAHFESAPEMISALKKAGLWAPEAISSAKLLAIALEQQGDYDDAIDICRRALDLGLEDGTKTGFEGRIRRLEKRKLG